MQRQNGGGVGDGEGHRPLWRQTTAESSANDESRMPGAGRERRAAPGGPPPRFVIASVASVPLSSGLEELDGIAVGIFDLDLFAPGTALHLVPKAMSGFFQRLNERREIADPQHDPVRSARLLLLTVRQRPGARGLWAAQQNLRVAERHTRERGQLLVLERETKIVRIERNGASHVLHLIADAVHVLHERMGRTALLRGCVGCWCRRHVVSSSTSRNELTCLANPALERDRC